MAPAPPLTVLQLTGDGLDERDGCVGWQGQGTQVLEDRAEAAQVGLALQEEITRLALNVDDVAGSRFAEAEDDERAGHARVTAYVVRQGLHGDLREAGSLGQAGEHGLPAQAGFQQAVYLLLGGVGVAALEGGSRVVLGLEQPWYEQALVVEQGPGFALEANVRGVGLG